MGGEIKHLHAGLWLFDVQRWHGCGTQQTPARKCQPTLTVYHPVMDDRPLREGTIRQIQDAVAQMFGLSIEELRTESRSREIAFPRQIAMYLSKQMTDASLSEIGQEFGGKHSTTVMHSIAKIHQL